MVEVISPIELVSSDECLIFLHFSSCLTVDNSYRIDKQKNSNIGIKNASHTFGSVSRVAASLFGNNSSLN